MDSRPVCICGKRHYADDIRLMHERDASTIQTRSTLKTKDYFDRKDFTFEVLRDMTR